MSYCDICHDDDVPSDFFCEICCSEPETREVERPVMFHDGWGSETELVEEDCYYSVCMNCCPDHGIPSKARHKHDGD